MYEESSSDDRTCLDLFHFAVTFGAVVFTIAGVAISSLCVVSCGLLGLLWGMGYFGATNTDS